MTNDVDLMDCRDCGMKLRPGFDTGGLCWRCVAHKATAIPAPPKAPTGTFIEAKMIPPAVHAEKIKQARRALAAGRSRERERRYQDSCFGPSRFHDPPPRAS